MCLDAVCTCKYIYIYTAPGSFRAFSKTVFSRHCLLDMVSCAITSGNRQTTYLKEFLVDVLVEELVGFLWRPSPGNPMTSTFPRPPLFTFAGEVADDPKLVAARRSFSRSTWIRRGSGDGMSSVLAAHEGSAVPVQY